MKFRSLNLIKNSQINCPPPHGICFWLSNPQRFIVVFLDWCLSLIGKEIMQTFSPKIPWGRFSNLVWLTSVFTPALTSEQTHYFYNVPHFLLQLVPSELYLYNESITPQFVTVLISGAAAEHATTRKQFNRTLSEFGQIQVFIEIQLL